MAIQRYLLYYTNDFQNDYPAISRAQTDGDWVHFEDVIPLEAEVTELKAKLAGYEQQRCETCQHFDYGFNGTECIKLGRVCYTQLRMPSVE